MLRIGSYNIHRAIGRDRREEAARIAHVLREIDADVVALQEVGYHPDTPGHLLEYLGDTLGAQVIDGVTFTDERGHYGNAVLTRLPVTGISRHDLSVPGREPRGAIEFALTINQIDIQLIATHLGLHPGERRDQIRTLLPLLEGPGSEVNILLGDLNEWFLWGRPLHWLRRVFGHLPAPATFPAHRPWFALDRLWVKPLAVIDAIHVHDSPAARIASDHLPLVAELNL
ncbi:MAG TPA: endonuclease [Thioalkalivibrio sp.]|nr:endonuclease [Thioalkalivibrio sp.]